jgi:hypothetical protein
MKNTTVLLLIGFCFLLFNACTPESKTLSNIEIDARTAYPDIPGKDFYAQIAPKAQTFEIFGNTDTVVVAEKGTIIAIPAHCFINETGAVESGNITFTVIEVVDKSSMMLSGLQTISGGQPLVSEGMIFLDATSAGKPLTIAEGNNLSITMPTMENNYQVTELQLFTGTYNSNNQMDWTATGRLKTNGLITIPAKYLDLSFTEGYGYQALPYPYDEDTFNTNPTEVRNTILLLDPKFNNTVITTREFKMRLLDIETISWEITAQKMKETNTLNFNGITMEMTLINIYMNNCNNTLRYCDSLAYAFLLEKSITMSLTNHYDNNSVNYLTVFKKYLDQQLPGVVEFPAFDFTSSNIRELLQNAGYTSSEISYFISTYNMREQVIAEYETAYNKVRAEQLEKYKKYQQTQSQIKTIYNTFETSNLGWINCDYFFKDSSAKPVNLIATLDSTKKYDFIQVILVLDDYNLLIQGVVINKGTVSITGKVTPYTKLPVGAKATLMAIGSINGEPCFEQKSIEIKEIQEIKLNPTVTTTENIVDAIKQINT